jgi:hypothetical protein
MRAFEFVSLQGLAASLAVLVGFTSQAIDARQVESDAAAAFAYSIVTAAPVAPAPRPNPVPEPSPGQPAAGTSPANSPDVTAPVTRPQRPAAPQASPPKRGRFGRRR